MRKDGPIWINADYGPANMANPIDFNQKIRVVVVCEDGKPNVYTSPYKVLVDDPVALQESHYQEPTAQKLYCHRVTKSNHDF